MLIPATACRKGNLEIYPAKCYTVEYINIHGFYHVIPNLVVRNEPNLDWFQGKYRRSDAENIGSVCLMVREKIGLQTDRRTDRQTDTAIT